MRSELIQSWLALGYSLLGLKYPWVLAVISAIGWPIPWAGELLAVIRALLVGLMMGPGLALAAAAYALAILCRVAENTIMPAEAGGKLDPHAIRRESPAHCTIASTREAH